MWWDEALNSNKMSQKDTTQQLKRHKKKAVAATEDPAKTPISLQLCCAWCLLIVLIIGSQAYLYLTVIFIQQVFTLDQS